MEVDYSVTIVAAAQRQRRRTHGHRLSIVAIHFVRSLLQRGVDNQLVTSPVVSPLLRRAADRVTVHAVRQT